MQQKDDVWFRGYLEYVSWVPVACIPPNDITDSFRASKRLKSPAWSHIHPNNIDSQNSLLPAQYLPWYMKQDLPSFSPLLQIRMYSLISLDTVWWKVMSYQSTTGFYLLPFSEQRLSQHGSCQWVSGHNGGF